MSHRIETLCIEEASLSDAVSGRFRTRFPEADVIVFRKNERRSLRVDRSLVPRYTLFLMRHRGAFLKPFPAHPWYDVKSNNRCGTNLVIGYSCTASCRYCFTQAYFEDSCPTLFTNIGEMQNALDRFLCDHPEERISMGEFTDSLLFDDVTGTVARTMAVMSQHPASRLEVQTKMASVDHLPENPPVNVQFAWTINPEAVVRGMEPGTPALETRLHAARTLKDKGYAVAFRIDPIIPVDRAIDCYSEMIERVNTCFPWTEASEVHLGSFRFNEAMLARLAGNPDGRTLLDAPFVRCPDGKYRIEKFSRTQLYTHLTTLIREKAPSIPITLTMEPTYIAKRVLNR